MRKSSVLLSLFAGLAMLAVPDAAPAGVFLSITIAPPALPVYVQPPCPREGLIWTPGYWAYGDVGYYWVPGVWVAPPRPGFLWTPAYWGFAGGFYGFHEGYWGPHVGFYGGINYGFGYGGFGYGGGEWRGERFVYNTAVTRVNTTVIHNTYVNNTVINNNVTRTSFNGPGGVNSVPRAEERVAEREQHVQAMQNQIAHERQASTNRAQFASVNHGQPAIAAVARPFGAAGQNRPAGVRPNGNQPRGFAQNQPNAGQPRTFGQNQQRPNGGPNAAPNGGPPNRQPNAAQAQEFNRGQRQNATPQAAAPQNRPQPIRQPNSQPRPMAHAAPPNRPSEPRPAEPRPEAARHEQEGHHERR